MSHSARSAWIETMVVSVSPVRGTCRTPQGVRGLKLIAHCLISYLFKSHSARSAWIETIGTKLNAHLAAVALRKECVD